MAFLLQSVIGDSRGDASTKFARLALVASKTGVGAELVLSPEQVSPLASYSQFFISMHVVQRH